MRTRLTGITAWYAVGVGQALSLLGTVMSQFALTIWAYEQTGQATTVTLMMFFGTLPMVILSPINGVLVDRFDRKLMMILSDLAAGLVTLVIFILLLAGELQLWHLYAGSVIVGCFRGLQWPAFSAAMTTMLEKDQLVRANSLIELGGTGANLLGPALAGALMGLLGAEGESVRAVSLLLGLDLITLSIGVGAILLIHVPPPVRTEVGQSRGENIIDELLFGMRYVLKRRSLFLAQLTFMVGNFFAFFAYSLAAPMVLARTGNNEIILGTVQSLAALGGIAGTLLFMSYGGFRNRIYGVLVGWVFSLLTFILVGLGRAEPAWLGILIWGGGLFLQSFAGTMTYVHNQSMWQTKTEPDVQGRVFSARFLMAWVFNPIAMAAAGPLADRFAEPAMMAGGSLAGTFGWMLGTGPGAGMSLIMVGAGAIGTLLLLGAFLVPQIRDIESLLPDFRPEIGAARTLDAPEGTNAVESAAAR